MDFLPVDPVRPKTSIMGLFRAASPPAAIQRVTSNAEAGPSRAIRGDTPPACPPRNQSSGDVVVQFPSAILDESLNTAEGSNVAEKLVTAEEPIAAEEHDAAEEPHAEGPHLVESHDIPDGDDEDAEGIVDEELDHPGDVDMMRLVHLHDVRILLMASYFNSVDPVAPAEEVKSVPTIPTFSSAWNNTIFGPL